MTRYTQAHWGVYEVEPGRSGEAPTLRPWRHDPDPSDIGLHALAPGLQALRVRRPAIRRSWLEHGPGSAPELRGREPFVEVEWELALDLVAGELARVRRDFGNTAIFGGSYGWSSAGRFHHPQSQVHRFLNTIGGYVRHTESYSLAAGWVIMPHVMMSLDACFEQTTSFAVMAEHTGLFVAFGGVPHKNSQMTAGGAAVHRTRDGLAAMARNGTRFVNISPVRDNLDTGAAVEWIPIRPNTDTALMLAVAFVLVRDGLVDREFLNRYCHGYERFEPYLCGAQPKTPEWAQQITGVPAARIHALAHEMATNRTMINVAWSLQRAAHGEQPFWMAVTLASMLGQIGLVGGGITLGYGAMNSIGSSQVRVPGPTLPQGHNAVQSFIPVARIADMLLNPGQRFSYNGGEYRYPDIRCVYWAGGNPFHHHQDLARLRLAFQRPQSIVIHEQYWTATAKFADVVLPATLSLERNDIGYAAGEGHLVAMRKATTALAEARDDFSIFAQLSDRLGVQPAFTEGRDEMGWLEHLYTATRNRAGERGVALPEFAAFWEQGIVSLGEQSQATTLLQSFREDPVAHRLGTASGRIEIYSDRIAGFDLPDCFGHPTWIAPAEWLGANLAGRYPLHLVSDQPARRLHSQLDASPHSLAGKVAGREPLYMHPDDATERGIRAGDVVEVFNDRGLTLAGAVLSTDIMRGVVRLSTGAWFDPDPDSGVDKHGNPNAVTRDVAASSLSQGCTAQTCLVDVRVAPLPVPLVTAHVLPPFALAGTKSASE